MQGQDFARLLDVFGARRWALATAGAALVGLTVTAGAGVGEVLRQSTRHHGLDIAAAAAAEAAAQAAALEHAAFVQPLLAREARELEIAKGESLALLLSRAGVAWSEINPITAVVNEVFNARRMRAGQPVKLYFAPQEGGVRLTGLAFRADPGASVTVSRTSAGGFVARELQVPTTFNVARLVATVDGSIYQAALEGGATEREVAALADAFAYDVDFQREVRPGDQFELLFERYVDDEGRTVRTGELLFASMRTRSGVKDFYRFTPPGESGADWFDAKGVSSRKFLMRTPVNGARLSSGFGLRRHPILGYSKLHAGADFAAASGTPVLAAGDGVVRRASRHGGYGNYIRLKHGDGYETAYAHLSRYASGVRPGVKVRQGQVIGYVGSTGRSTGPHLHYEVLLNGKHTNPMKLKGRTGTALSGKALQAFEEARERIETMRTGQGPLGATLIAAADTTQGRIN
jgi:murein DD-endopeptidase MepM/ murein hydrolase activator NlpD